MNREEIKKLADRIIEQGKRNSEAAKNEEQQENSPAVIVETSTLSSLATTLELATVAAMGVEEAVELLLQLGTTWPETMFSIVKALEMLKEGGSLALNSHLNRREMSWDEFEAKRKQRMQEIRGEEEE